MEKRNMKVRLPNQGGQAEMLKRVQQLQEDMANTQAELESKEYDVRSGGGMVNIRINGKKEILSVKLDPTVVTPDDVEMLEDLLAAAVNEAIRLVEDTNEQEMSKLTGGLNLPGLGL